MFTDVNYLTSADKLQVGGLQYFTGTWKIRYKPQVIQ